MTTLTIPRQRLSAALTRVSDAALARLEARPSRRWAAALTRAMAWLDEQSELTFEALATDTPILIVASASHPGVFYHVGATCPCHAGANDQPCWHRAARIVAVRALALALDEARAAETPAQRERREYRMWLARRSAEIHIHRSVPR